MVAQIGPEHGLEDHKHQEKLKHINACLLPDSQYKKSAGFEGVELAHEPTAGLSLHNISLATTFLNKKLKAPLMIAPMTGGTELGAILNRRWAYAAEHFSLAFGVGSQRLALMDERVKESFCVRRYAPTALIFANLGGAQLVGPNAHKQAIEAVKMINADALFIHLNPVQEACKSKGDYDFSNLLPALSKVVEAMGKEGIPTLVREVGFGLSKKAAKDLVDIKVSGLDCAGAGGTSWTKVEALCSDDDRFRKLGVLFGEWGIPTVQSIINVRSVNQHIPLIATGGIRSGLDVAKALALGADIAAMAQPMLAAAIQGEDKLFGFIEQIVHELRVAMYASGAKSVKDLRLATAHVPNGDDHKSHNAGQDDGCARG